MNKIIIINILFLLIFSASSSSATITEEFTKTLKQTCKAAETVSIGIGSFLLTTILHEAAHALLAQAALSLGADVVENPALSISNYGPIPLTIYPVFKNRIISALIEIAGPASSMAAVYGTLKANNIINEYQKSGDIRDAITQGMKKGIWNSEQHPNIRAAALARLIVDGAMLVPYKVNGEESHGYNILKDFGIIRENK